MSLAKAAVIELYCEDFLRQMYAYLCAFTDGAAGGTVATLG